MANKGKDKTKADDVPIDLAARIGGRSYEPMLPPRPAAPPATAARLDGPLPPRRDARPAMIGIDEPPAPPLPTRAAVPASDAAVEEAPDSGAIASPRTPPGPGEIDIVITPLPTPDDWHRFEIALRRVRGLGHGLGELKTEYYRHGVLKVRVKYGGTIGLGQVLRAGVPGYRVRVIGEDRTTIQLLIAGDEDERRPG